MKVVALEDDLPPHPQPCYFYWSTTPIGLATTSFNAKYFVEEWIEIICGEGGCVKECNCKYIGPRWKWCDKISCCFPSKNYT